MYVRLSRSGAAGNAKLLPALRGTGDRPTGGVAVSGIAGVIAWTQPPEATAQVVRLMTATLAHRGRCAVATWSGERAALGQSRLPLTGLEAGAEPLRAQVGDGHVVLTFTGEIYNHASLRLHLTSRGHTFTARSQAEVILNAYLQWGEACVERLEGMFCFAVWDSRSQELLLARDRFGIKSLYYALRPAGIVFGSEIKALLAAGVPAELGPDGLAELTAMVPMSTPGSAVFHRIGELPAATVLRYAHGGHTMRRYWALQAAPHTDDLHTTVRTVRSLLADSVRQQLAGETPIAALNSGGLDSSSVVAIAAGLLRDTGQDLVTFDVEHTGETGAGQPALPLHTEAGRPHAVVAAGHFENRHHTVTLSAGDLLAAQYTALETLDLPSLSTTTVSLGLLLERLSQHAPVVLSGEGANALFHGYHWFHDHTGYDHTGWPWHQTFRPVASLLNRATLQHAKPRWFALQHYHAALAEVPSMLGEDRQERRMRQVCTLTMRYYLPYLLRCKDRLSTRHGVQARMPFLSRQLAEYAWNIPAHMKHAGGMEKGLLRQAVEHLLPHQTASRPKSGYPARLLPTFQKALWAQARELLASPSSPLLPLLDTAKVTGLLDQHDGDLSGWTALQSVAYLMEIDTWLRHYQVRIL
ncbi:MAG TPA: asparagine synthase (glutamine-hydrolyzing) [Micromonosporaceae bacterium]|nr:asparagine synthase (glutamine-hydrolyzing) [Micromonosporaceae bacterium]